jgi:hypothetical protein
MAAVEAIVPLAVAGIRLGLGFGLAEPVPFTLPANANGGTGIFPAGRDQPPVIAACRWCFLTIRVARCVAFPSASGGKPGPAAYLLRPNWPSCLAIRNRGIWVALCSAQIPAGKVSAGGKEHISVSSAGVTFAPGAPVEIARILL